MKRFQKSFCLILLLMLSLSGCRQNGAPVETEPLCRYVTQVDVTCRQAGQTVHRQYTRDEKIESVLLYLRLLKNRGDTAEVPVPEDSTEYDILLTFSDGRQRLYRQRGTEYLSQDAGPWQILEPGQGRNLLTLIRLMPSDGAL